MLEKKKVFLLFTITVAAAGLVLGCSCEEPPKPAPAKSQVAKPPAPVPAPAPIARTDPPPTLVEELQKRIELPQDYPEDGLVYPGSQATTTSWIDGRLSVMFNSMDPADDVASYATEFLANEGWERLSRTDLPNGVYIRANKSRGRAIAVLISDLEESDEDPGTLIAVVVDP